MPTWPASLPKCPIPFSANIGAPQKALLRSEMDTGPAKVRPRTTAAVRPLTLKYGPMTAAQYDTFETFHADDLIFGVLSFDLHHPITRAPITVRFAGEDDHYSVETLAFDCHIVTLKLEILP